MYDGDTVRAFVRKVPDYKSIIGFEPDKKNISKWKDRSKYHDVRIINKGVWSEKTKLSFSEGGTASMITTEGDDTIEVTTIDSEVSKEEKVTYIKMDIEGSELEALKGAKETIQRCMPKLAICVYHKKEDLITIPQYLRSFRKEDRGY